MTNTTPRCSCCNKFCQVADSETPFGCRNPAAPEPYDPYEYCSKCADKLKASWDARFASGRMEGYWQKSSAEIVAAKKHNLVWNHSKYIYEKNQ